VMMNAHFYLGVLFADGARGGGQFSPASRTAGGSIVGRASRDLDDLKLVLECPGSLRVHANWFNVDTGDILLEEGKILEVLLNNTKSDAQRLDEWIKSHPERVGTYVPESLSERLISGEDRCEQEESTASTP
jgi:TusA-related sulfurtransferase